MDRTLSDAVYFTLLTTCSCDTGRYNTSVTATCSPTQKTLQRTIRTQLTLVFSILKAPTNLCCKRSSAWGIIHSISRLSTQPFHPTCNAHLQGGKAPPPSMLQHVPNHSSHQPNDSTQRTMPIFKEPTQPYHHRSSASKTSHSIKQKILGADPLLAVWAL